MKPFSRQLGYLLFLTLAFSSLPAFADRFKSLGKVSKISTFAKKMDEGCSYRIKVSGTSYNAVEVSTHKEGELGKVVSIKSLFTAARLVDIPLKGLYDDLFNAAKKRPDGEVSLVVYAYLTNSRRGGATLEFRTSDGYSVSTDTTLGEIDLSKIELEQAC